MPEVIVAVCGRDGAPARRASSCAAFSTPPPQRERRGAARRCRLTRRRRSSYHSCLYRHGRATDHCRRGRDVELAPRFASGLKSSSLLLPSRLAHPPAPRCAHRRRALHLRCGSLHRHRDLRLPSRCGAHRRWRRYRYPVHAVATSAGVREPHLLYADEGTEAGAPHRAAPRHAGRAARRQRDVG